MQANQQYHSWNTNAVSYLHYSTCPTRNPHANTWSGYENCESSQNQQWSTNWCGHANTQSYRGAANQSNSRDNYPLNNLGFTGGRANKHKSHLGRDGKQSWSPQQQKKSNFQQDFRGQFHERKMPFKPSNKEYHWVSYQKGSAEDYR